MFLNLEEFEEVQYAPSKPSDDSDWVMVNEGDWVSSGKWDYQECIVQNHKTDKHYKYELSRSGSYYFDYYYPHVEDEKGVGLSEVKPVEKTITVTTWEYV